MYYLHKLLFMQNRSVVSTKLEKLMLEIYLGMYLVQPLPPPSRTTLYYRLNIKLRRILHRLQVLQRDLYVIVVSDPHDRSLYTHRALLKIVLIPLILY